MQHHSNKKQKTVKKSVLHKWQIHQLDDLFYFCGFNYLNLLLKNIEWMNVIIIVLLKTVFNCWATYYV